MKKLFFLITLVGFMLFSCQKTTDIPLAGNNASDGIDFYSSGTQVNPVEGTIILGNQIPNPLTVSNMKQAWNNLYNQKITTLLPTHKYVRFLPTYEEYELLQKMDDIDLWDYPLDREIVQNGTYYHDPSVPDNQVTWQYAIVDADFVSPVANYEVLDELVIVDYNTHWIEEAYKIKNLPYKGAPYGFYDPAKPTIEPPSQNGTVKNLPPIPDCPPGCTPVLILNDVGGVNAPQWIWDCDCSGGGGSPSVCGCPAAANIHKPSGSVRVMDTQHNGGQLEGVGEVRVIAWRSDLPWGTAFRQRTFTDENGCWQMKHEYTKKRKGQYKPIDINVKVKFKNPSVVIRGMSSTTDIGGYMTVVQQTVAVTGVIDLSGICISYGVATTGLARERYFAATAMKAYFEYNNFAAQDGIAGTGNLDILVHPFTPGAAAAPMLDKLNGGLLQELSTAYGIEQIINAYAAPLGTLAYPSIVFAPDIFYGYGSTSSDQIKATLFHEFAHASHFQRVSNEYWKDNVAYIVNNVITGNVVPYGTLTTPGAGRTGVIEMWGFHYGPTLADRLYGLEHSNPVVGTQQTQESQRHLKILERTLNIWGGVIPAGLDHDLIDVVNSTGDPATNDNFGGYTNAMIFNQMNSSILSPAQLKAPLTGVAPGVVTGTQINALFGDYGF